MRIRNGFLLLLALVLPPEALRAHEMVLAVPEAWPTVDGSQAVLAWQRLDGWTWHRYHVLNVALAADPQEALAQLEGGRAEFAFLPLRLGLERMRKSPELALFCLPLDARGDLVGGAFFMHRDDEDLYRGWFPDFREHAARLGGFGAFPAPVAGRQKALEWIGGFLEQEGLLWPDWEDAIVIRP